MAKGLQTLLKQINLLQKQADTLRAKEKAGVIARIQEAIAHYDIAPNELYGKNAAAPVKARKATAKGSKKRPAAAAGPRTERPAKFADEQGHTWSGIGKRPDWFKAALAAGKTPEQLMIAK